MGGLLTTEANARACPRDYVTAGLIGTASGIIGNARRVMATADWTEPAPLWFAMIGMPSVGKTPALSRMIEVCRVIERDDEPAWREAFAAYERDAEAARARGKAWRDAVRAAAADGTALPDRPANAIQPDAPPRPRVVMMNTSTEELMNVLAETGAGYATTAMSLPPGLVSLIAMAARTHGQPDAMSLHLSRMYFAAQVQAWA